MRTRYEERRLAEERRKAAKRENGWLAKLSAATSNDRPLVKIFAGATALLVLFIFLAVQPPTLADINYAEFDRNRDIAEMKRQRVLSPSLEKNMRELNRLTAQNARHKAVTAKITLGTVIILVVGFVIYTSRKAEREAERNRRQGRAAGIIR